MNPKCTLNLYRDFLIANHNRFSGLEMARVTPTDMTHDAVSRFLARSDYTPSDLWQKVASHLDRGKGYLVIDDSLLGKPYSRENELAQMQWSGKTHDVVNGIALVNLLWTDGAAYLPVDYRVYDKRRDDKTKNDHFQEMLDRAEKRGFKPAFVLMDAWYGSLENLKRISRKGWRFMAGLAANRQVNEVPDQYVPVSALDFAETPVKQVWLRGYGPVLVLRILDKNGEARYVATNDLTLAAKPEEFNDHWDHRWTIGEYHRGLKQTTGIEKCYSTQAASQRTHIFAAIVAFVKLELKRIRTGISWYEQKALIGRGGTRVYLGSA